MLRKAASILALAAVTLNPSQASEQERWTIDVDGVAREALVFAPEGAASSGTSGDAAAPLVLSFHGHGGRARAMARGAPLHSAWPEAVVIYPQGLPTAGFTDPEGKLPGWQHAPGDEGDRDLAFFDALLSRAKVDFRVDPDRVHATGHSNGGGFTYLLLATRGDVLASVAPSSAASRQLRRGVILPPRPVFHAGCRADRVVPWARQGDSLGKLREQRACEAGRPWAIDERVTRYPSASGGDVLVFEHEGGHRKHPDFHGLAAKFFEAHPRPARDDASPLTLELVHVQRAWDRAPHQAFTDLCRFGEDLILTFREGDGHVNGADGKVRVLTSRDGRTWTPRGLLEEPGVDLRDPKVSVTPGGELMILAGGSRYLDGVLQGRAPRVAFWERGAEFPARMRAATLDAKIASKDDWLWRVTWAKQVGFGVVYQPQASPPGHHLVRTEDGARYDLLASFDHPGQPNEATLRVLPDGRLIALVRRDPFNATARIGHAPPPFEEWTWVDLPEHLGGPELLVLDDGRMLAAGRVYRDGVPRTAVGEVTLDGAFQSLLMLPSGGDTSYPGAVLDGEDLLLSYYSSHEQRTAIYVARIRVRRRGEDPEGAPAAPAPDGPPTGHRQTPSTDGPG